MIKQLLLHTIWVCSLCFMLPQIGFSINSPNDKLGLGSEIPPISIDISGKVTDQGGEPLIGVNVLVQGTNNGTSTDFEGNYSLSNVDGDAIIVFSYVGYETQEIQVNSQTTINLEMVSDAQLLDELVVIGYGTVKKSDLTGAVDRIEMDDKENQANVNLLQSLF